jgi:DNA-binding NtrC family response regulator
MQEVMKTLKKVSPTDANILLLGENGTENLFWRNTFIKILKRNNEPFVHIDLGSF